MEIIIYTEAGRGIGFGHLTRCIGLAQAFRERGAKCNLFVYGDRSITPQLSSFGGQRNNWLNNRRERLRYLKKSSMVIVDSYLASKHILNDLQKNSALIYFIDDNQRVIYPPGGIINGSLNALQLKYKKYILSPNLLGPKYTPLRNCFWDTQIHHVRGGIKKILITFGGTDEANVTSLAIDTVKRKYSQVQIIVVIGNGFRNQSILLKQKEQNLRFVVSPDDQQMLQLIQDADLAVSSGGQTLYEFARCGLPAVVIVVADNQKKGVEAWAKTGLFFPAGMHNSVQLTDRVAQGLKKITGYQFRQRCMQKGPGFVDGQGARRIAGECLKNYANRYLHIRHVEKKDMKAIWSLSNQPNIRKSSFHPKVIKWQDHCKWFREILSDNKIIFLVAYAKNTLIGQIRFYLKNDDAIVSISVNPIFQNYGIGKKLLFSGMRYIRKKNIHTVTAYIKKENRYSQNYFGNLGFKKINFNQTPHDGICMRLDIKK